MFLRSTVRLKDGKEHYYWSIVENRRCRGDRVVQQTVLYLGEINDSQRESSNFISPFQRPISPSMPDGIQEKEAMNFPFFSSDLLLGHPYSRRLILRCEISR